MRKRKILFLIPSLVGGGAERTLINLLHHIDYDIYSVDLVSVLKKGPYLNQVPNQVKLITLFNNEFLLKLLSLIKRKTGFDFFFKLMMKLNVKKNYDVGISFLDCSYTEFLFYTQKINKKYTWVHTSYKTNKNFSRFYQNKRYREYVKKNRYEKLDGIFFVSEDSMNEFIEVFGTFPNMRVIYNLVDKKKIKEKAGKRINFKKNVFTFISVGSLIPVKGYDKLIKAAGIIANQGYKFKIIILGDGFEKENLKKLINKLKIDEFIELKGFVNNPYPYMLQSDVFVMSSVSEALPTVLIEAMILGKPVVVTNSSGCREIVDYGKYGLMAEQNESELAKKMLIFLNNVELLKEYERKSLERSKLFDDDQVLSQYYEVFDS